MGGSSWSREGEDAMGTKIGRFASCAALALIMAVGFVVVGSADAVGNARTGGPWHGRRGNDQGGGRKAVQALRRLAQDPALQERLGLAAPQVERLQGLWTKTKSTLGRQRDALAQHEAELRALIGDAAASREAIEEKASDLIRARGEIARAVLDAVLDARDVLTQDQRVALRQAIRERRGERRGKGADASGGEGESSGLVE
jgi:Spy/CpxP family protein refolding chaperone